MNESWTLLQRSNPIRFKKLHWKIITIHEAEGRVLDYGIHSRNCLTPLFEYKSKGTCHWSISIGIVGGDRDDAISTVQTVQ